MVDADGRFVWYELMTSDVEAAKAFYADVVGWGTQDASMPGMGYTLFTAGSGLGTAGCWTCRRTRGNWARGRAGSDMSASTTWTPLPTGSSSLGGTVYVPPRDVPNISRFSVVS